MMCCSVISVISTLFLIFCGIYFKTEILKTFKQSRFTLRRMSLKTNQGMDQWFSSAEVKRVTSDTSVACRHYVIPAFKWKNNLMEGSSFDVDMKCPEKEQWVVLKKDQAIILCGRSTHHCSNHAYCNFSELLYYDDFTAFELQTTQSRTNYHFRNSNCVKVSCLDPANNKKWSDILQSPWNPAVDTKQKGWNFTKPEAVKLNVLIWLFDSVSHNNFKRSLPKSWRYIRSAMNGTRFLGYNLVGHNTAPNMMPFHTGIPFPRWQEKSKKRYIEDTESGSSTLLHTFRKYGYITGYFEENQMWPDSGTFQFWYDLGGFRNQLADVYSRTFMITCNNFTSQTWRTCLQNMTMNQGQQEFAKEFWKAYKKYPKFFMSHSSTYSHDDEDLIKIIDSELAQFLRWANRKEIRENTAIILMSDHGFLRKNKLWPSVLGHFEARMPLLHIFLPKWFPQKFPQAFRNFEINAKERLVTTLDIHRTLKSLLDFETFQENSLFREIAKKRTCASVGIDETYCACADPLFDLDFDEKPMLRQCCQDALESINEWLQSKIKKKGLDSSLCGNWSLLEIKNAWKFSRDSPEEITTYYVSFTANPGTVPMSAKLVYNSTSKVCACDKYSVLRQDRYDRHTQCIDGHSPGPIRPWCYCKQNL